MVRLTAALMAAFLVAGCASIETPLDDGYDLGDGSRIIYGTASHFISLRNAYCLAATQELRDELLGTIQTIRPGYPEGGLCGD